MLPIVRPTRSRLNRMFDNILRGLVVEFRTQHSALRYASGRMLGQSEDFQIYSYKWYRSPLNIKRVVPNITSARLNESRAFYTEFLGFQVVMDMDWIITLASSTNPTAQISLVRGNRSGIEHQDMTVSIEVADVDGGTCQRRLARLSDQVSVD